MKFLFDHDVPDDLSHLLRQFGRKVILLREAHSTDSSDSAVLQSARNLDAILVTCNRDDFLQLAPKEPHPVIINQQLRPKLVHCWYQESEALQNRDSAINARK